MKLKDILNETYETDYNSNWDVKYPPLNISKNEIRKLVRKVHKGSYVFGTPGDFNGNNLTIQLSNYQPKSKSEFTTFCKNIVTALKKITKKNITYKVTSKNNYYGDYMTGKADLDFDRETGKNFKGQTRQDFTQKEYYIKLKFN